MTMGPIATGRRAEAFESEMKNSWGVGGVSRVRKRVKVIRNLRERAKVRGWGWGRGRGRE